MIIAAVLRADETRGHTLQACSVKQSKTSTAPLYRKGYSKMLGVKTYEREFVDACRKKIAGDVNALKRVVLEAKGNDQAVRELETRYCNNMVIVLDALFMHRLRTVEGKDGNPLNEVRVLTTSLVENGGTMTPDKTIK